MNIWLRSTSDLLRTRVRTWLGLKDPQVFMGIDLGYRDWTAVVLIKRSHDRSNELFECINFEPGTPFSVIQDTCRDLAKRYGVDRRDFIQDTPAKSIRIQI
jgi:hypothetical protein